MTKNRTDEIDEVIDTLEQDVKSGKYQGKKTIAHITAEYMRRHDYTAIPWDYCYLIDEITDLLYRLGISKIHKQHPMDRHISFLNRLEGSPLFEKRLYKIITGPGDAEHLCRIFYLKGHVDD